MAQMFVISAQTSKGMAYWCTSKGKLVLNKEDSTPLSIGRVLSEHSKLRKRFPENEFYLVVIEE